MANFRLQSFAAEKKNDFVCFAYANRAVGKDGWGTNVAFAVRKRLGRVAGRKGERVRGRPRWME